MSFDDPGRQPRSGIDRRISSDGNGKVGWDLILKISQVAIYPLLGAMLYLLMQMHVMDRRLAVIEVTTARPSPDVELVRKIAIIEDRQNTVMSRLADNGNEIRKIADAINEHDARENYRRGK